MRLCIVVLFSLFIGSILSGQNRQDSLSNWYYTVSPSAFINVYPGIQMGIERKFKETFNVELEGAYLYPTSSLADRIREGFRVKLGVKHQVRDNFYLNLIFFYRKVYYNRVNVYSRYGGAFFEDIEIEKTKRLIGPTLGMSFTSNDLGDNIILESGISFGLGKYRVVANDDHVPDDAEFVNQWIFDGFREEGDYNFPIISLQLKLKFGL